MLEDGVEFLEGYIDDLLNEKQKLPKSYDLWEEFEGVSLYSISSIYAAFSAMVSMMPTFKEVSTRSLMSGLFLMTPFGNTKRALIKSLELFSSKKLSLSAILFITISRSSSL